jgi:hypothetical protein
MKYTKRRRIGDLARIFNTLDRLKEHLSGTDDMIANTFLEDISSEG